jgi:hypothetical protein
MLNYSRFGGANVFILVRKAVTQRGKAFTKGAKMAAVSSF